MTTLTTQLVLSRLRASWRGGALAFALPGGEVARIGDGAAAEVRVHDERAFRRVLLRGELGAGEGYVAGEWDADDLPAVAAAFLRGTGARGVESWLTRAARLPAWLRHRLGGNHRAGARRRVRAHYDLGTDLYRLFLDDAMVYSCAIWKGGDDLAAAQRRKLDRVCELADLQPGDRVLELGCGWGALAIHAARERGCRVTAVTISDAQAGWAEAAVRAAGVADRVTIERRDYRDTSGVFDRVLSIEMLEAVGGRYLPTFFRTVAARLRRGGRAVVQTITIPDDRHAEYRRGVDWMQTYVFPGTEIPSLGAIRRAEAGTGLTTTSVDEIGPSYAPTLRAWRDRFAAREPEVRALGFDDGFVRTWRLYLAFSEAAFGAGTLGDAQVTMAR
jgi:cyclopropane-fatty-acyl-phospholipid synthase